ncbi:hypothetical protein CSC43_0218 [Pseudomonas aeruginosa]|nr:hypothetical protein CSC43_0218 [Pseudomonas aeruginosa]
MIAMGIPPGPQPILCQRAIYGFQSAYLVLAATVVSADPAGQVTIDHFQFCTDELDAETFGEGPQN